MAGCVGINEGFHHSPYVNYPLVLIIMFFSVKKTHLL